MDSEAKRDLISVRLQMLIEVFGKRVSDNSLAALKRVYIEALEHMTETAITKGFSKAEQTQERFPTPKVMKEICSQFMPSDSWTRDYKPSEDEDPQYGGPVQVLIDPDPTCVTCRQGRSTHPHKRCKEYKASDRGDDKVMFRPQDCPEGREFLSRLEQK